MWKRRLSRSKESSLLSGETLPPSGVLPENRIQFVCVHSIGTRKIHLLRLLRPRSLLVVHFEEKPGAQVCIVGLIGRLRSRPREQWRHERCMTVEQVHRRESEQVFHRMDHAYGGVEMMVN